MLKEKNKLLISRQGIKFLFITLFFLVTFFSSFLNVSAQPEDPYNNPNDLYGYGAFQESSLGDRDPRNTIVSIINISLGLVSAVCTGLIVYAGYLWMTAGGNDEQVGKAKKIITGSIIGLIIILLAYSISNFVIIRLYEASQSKPYGGRDLF